MHAHMFNLPSDNLLPLSQQSRRVNVVQFDHSGDLLATVDSDNILRVYSIGQNTYVLRRQFSSAITAVEFKSGFEYRQQSVFLGFKDGSINLLVFPAGVYYVRGLLRIPYIMSIL